jgi:hypothetical protein
MNIYIPYTYLIGWTHLNKYYYGVRYSKKCNPSDLWVSYFTSSKIVKHYRVEHGEPDVIQIRKLFDNPQSARLWEYKVLKRLGCIKDTKWLNQSNAGETFFFVERSPEHRKKQSIALKGRKLGPQSEEQKRNKSIRMTGVKRGPQSPEHKAKRAAAMKGQKRSEEAKQNIRLARLDYIAKQNQQLIQSNSSTYDR